jgi:Virulence-associated protein E
MPDADSEFLDAEDLRERHSDHITRALECNEAALDAAVLIRSDKGVIKPCEHNARVLIAQSQQYTSLHYDEFRARLRIDDRDWGDADDLEALCWLQSQHQVAAFTLAHARNAAKALAHSRRRDSLREFVESLPKWDVTPRIERAFIHAWGAQDTALVRAASRNFFIALIARALKPGAQVDTLWTFEGAQGTYKSRSIRELGGEFHAEISAAIGTIDFQRELRGLWIAELSELDSLRGRESSTIKRLLSAPADRFVEKYQAHATTYRRRAVAVATTNEAAYWQDATGARRLVPIACGTIRIDIIKDNRLQWLAEALHLYRHGATWWEFPKDIVHEQEARQQGDPWEDNLRQAIAHGRRTGLDGQGVIPWPEGWISSAAIMRDWLCVPPHLQGRPSGVRLGHVMRKLGFRSRQFGTHRERGWEPEPNTQTPDEKKCSPECSAQAAYEPNTQNT